MNGHFEIVLKYVKQSFNFVGEDNYFSGCQPLKNGHFLFKAL